MDKGIYELQFYKEGDLYYWRVIAANNERIGKSEQGFKSKEACKNNFELLCSLGR